MSDLLPVLLYTMIPKTNEDPPDTCAICQEKYGEMDMVTFLYCNHLFHYDCISRWIDNKGTCPYCRNEDMNAKISKKYRNSTK